MLQDLVLSTVMWLYCDIIVTSVYNQWTFVTLLLSSNNLRKTHQCGNALVRSVSYIDFPPSADLVSVFSKALSGVKACVRGYVV